MVKKRRFRVLNLFNWLSKEPSSEWLFIYGSIDRTHQHGTGAATNDDEAIGKSRGGNSTNIHLALDSYVLPVCFSLYEGQVHDIVHAEGLINQSPKSSYIVADKGYDSENLREHIHEKGAISVIPRRKNNKTGNHDMDWCLYKYRHLVENAYGRIKISVQEQRDRIN